MDIQRYNKRPRQRWIDTVKSDLGECAPGLKLEESEDEEIVEAEWAIKAWRKNTSCSHTEQSCNN